MKNNSPRWIPELEIEREYGFAVILQHKLTIMRRAWKTYKVIAEMLGVSDVMVGYWYRGKHHPAQSLERIDEGYNLAIEILKQRRAKAKRDTRMRSKKKKENS